MIFVLSPAKILKPVIAKTTPLLFPNETKRLLEQLKNLSFEQVKKMTKASDEIVYNTLLAHRSPKRLGPAGWVYKGEAFKALSIEAFTPKQLEYLKDHLLIFSALYGLTQIDTEIHQHRLDYTMKTPFTPTPFQLFEPLVNQYLEDELIINVASQEFSQMLDRSKMEVIDVFFYDKGKIVSILAKQARGEMVRVATLNQVTNLEELKQCQIFNYTLNPHLSTQKKLVYQRD